MSSCERSVRVFGQVLIVGFALVACYRGDPSYRGKDMELEAADFDFQLIQAGHVSQVQFNPEDPAFPTKGWRLEPETETTFALNNADTLPHTWVVLKAGVEVGHAAEVSDQDVLFRAEADPEERVEGVIPPLPVGRYQVICVIPGHLEKGMSGWLVVGGET